MSRRATDPSSAWRLAAQPAIVGRERELGLLREIVEQAVAGHGGLVLLAGEAGIGKTTLSGAISREASDAGILVLSGGCYDLTTTPPYGPWVEVLRDYPGGGNLPEMPAQLQAGGGMAGIDSQAALFDLVGRLLKSVAAEQPLLILLEDLHWADPATLDLLRYLSRTLAGEAALLIATYRDDEIGRDHPLVPVLPALVREGRVHRLRLQRLDRDAVLAMARERYRLGDEDEARLMAYLDRLAEGNPFFTNELLYTLEERQILSPATGGWRLGDLTDAGVPTLVQQVIDGRLARLEDTPRALLDLAAVIGYDAPLDLLTEMHDGSSMELDVALQRLIDQRLLEVGAGGSTVRFHHALVRQAIYEEIPLLQRRALHRRAGEALESTARPDIASVANHFYEAGDERALEWLERAAEQAQSLFAPASVIDHAGRGIRLAGRLNLDSPLGLYRLRGLARESAGDFDGARADHELALERAQSANDQGAEWQALLDLGALWASRDYEQTREYCQRAVDLARMVEDPSSLGHSLNRLGNWYTNADLPAEALRYHKEALEIFERLDDQSGVASTHDLLALAHYSVGDMQQSLRHYQLAIPLLRQGRGREALAFALAMVASISGLDWCTRAVRCQEVSAAVGATPETLCQEAVQVAASSEWRTGEAFVLGLSGSCAIARGDLRAGLQYLSDSLTLAEQIEHHQWIALANTRFGSAYMDLLMYDRAIPHLERALEIARLIRSRYFVRENTSLLVCAYTGNGDLDRAERALQPDADLEASLMTLSARESQFAYTELLVAQGRHQEALENVDRIIDSLPDGAGNVSPHLTMLRGGSLLACGRQDEAKNELEEAYSVAAWLGHRHVQWKILALLARLHVAQGRVEEARETGDAALQIIDELAEQLDDEELRAEFLTNARAQILGVAPYRSDREAVYAGLTPRELEVLRAVADGLTDAEVGERLYIATRTVSQHLRSVYNKLGVNNRAAAVRIAVEQGLV